MTVLVWLPTGGHHLLILSGDNKISGQKLQRYSCPPCVILGDIDKFL